MEDSEDLVTRTQHQSLVLRHLGTVENSRNFKEAPALKKLLRYLVESVLEDPLASLPAPVIARAVYGRGADFNSVQDPVVRVTAMRLRKALAIYYTTEGKYEDVVIELEPGSYKPTFRVRSTEDVTTLRDHVVTQLALYQEVASEATFSKAVLLVEAALAKWPDDSELISDYAVLCSDRLVFGYQSQVGQLDKAQRLIEKANSLADKRSVKLEFNTALIALHLGHLDDAIESADVLLETANGDLVQAALGKFLHAVNLCPGQEGFQTHDPDPAVAEQLTWLNYSRFARNYQKGDYEAALSNAIDFAMPTMFWGPMIRASTLGQLGLKTVAKSELAKAAQLNRRFLENPGSAIQFYMQTDNISAHFMEGLEKAGLQELQNA
ncbi:MAG: hypothetical protein ACR2O8_02545 [Rhizobiaceae bacterium]